MSDMTIDGGPVLHIVLAVKVRAFHVDIVKLNYTHDVPMPLPLEWVADNQTIVGLDQRGVSLHITLDAQAPTPAPPIQPQQNLPAPVQQVQPLPPPSQESVQ